MYVDAEFIPANIAVSADASIVEQFEVLQWRPAVDAMPNAPLFAEMQCDLAASREYDAQLVARSSPGRSHRSDLGSSLNVAESVRLRPRLLPLAGTDQ